MNTKHLGMTMVEMLISLLLSTVLIGGMGSLFVQVQKSNAIQNANSYMMDDARYVIELIQKELRRTGALRSREDINGQRDDVFIVDNNVFGSGLNFDSKEAIKGSAIVGQTNDSLMIRYQLNDTNDLNSSNPSNSNSPCTQNISLGAGEDPAIQVHVVTIYFYVSNNNLVCRAKREIINPITQQVATATPGGNPTSVVDPTVISLIGNVQQLVATYGVDSDANQAADFYTQGVNIATADWSKVISLQLSLVLRSEVDNLTPTATPYMVNGSPVTTSDKRLYRVFGTSVGMRNLLF